MQIRWFNACMSHQIVNHRQHALVMHTHDIACILKKDVFKLKRYRTKTACGVDGEDIGLIRSDRESPD